MKPTRVFFDDEPDEEYWTVPLARSTDPGSGSGSGSGSASAKRPAETPAAGLRIEAMDDSGARTDLLHRQTHAGTSGLFETADEARMHFPLDTSGGAAARGDTAALRRRRNTDAPLQSMVETVDAMNAGCTDASASVAAAMSTSISAVLAQSHLDELTDEDAALRDTLVGQMDIAAEFGLRDMGQAIEDERTLAKPAEHAEHVRKRGQRLAEFLADDCPEYNATLDAFIADTAAAIEAMPMNTHRLLRLPTSGAEPLFDLTTDDAARFLRSPILAKGERSCALAGSGQCIAYSLAMRAPVTPARATLQTLQCPREFMTPEQEQRWESAREPPETHGMCLLCIRFAVTGTAVLSATQGQPFVLQHHRVAVDRPGGYKRDVLLEAQCDGLPNGVVAPQVRFKPEHYALTKNGQMWVWEENGAIMHYRADF